MGGYSLPSLSTLGSHVHLSSAGTPSITAGTWFPHPHQVVFSKKQKKKVRQHDENKTQSAGTLTACIAGSFSAHVSDANVVGNYVGCTWCDGEDRKYTRSGRGLVFYTRAAVGTAGSAGFFPLRRCGFPGKRGAGEVADSNRASGPLFRRFRGRRRHLACKRADGRTSST